jgi:tetratricopeptide (TPR) repeat protein
MKPQRTVYLLVCLCGVSLLAAPVAGAQLSDSATSLSRIAAVAFEKTDNDRALALWREALGLYRASGRRSEEAATLYSLGILFDRKGSRDSAMTNLRTALQIQQSLGENANAAVTLVGIGAVFSRTGVPDSALAYYKMALPIQRASEDRLNEAKTLHNIGVVYGRTGHPDSALAYYHAALPMRRRAKDGVGEAATLSSIGTVFSNTGYPDSALAYYQAALPLRRAVSDRAGEATTLNNIGALFGKLGRPDSAMVYYKASLPLRRAVADRVGEGATLSNIGTSFRNIGLLDSALHYYRAALAIRRSIADRAGEGTTLSNIGVTFMKKSRPDSALVYYRLALPIRHEAGDRAGEASTLMRLGSAMTVLGQLDSALTHLRGALALHRAARNRFGEGRDLAELGSLMIAMGHSDSAVTYLNAAIALAHETGDTRTESEALGQLSTAQRAAGQLAEARTTAKSALAVARTAGLGTLDLSGRSADARADESADAPTRATVAVQVLSDTTALSGPLHIAVNVAGGTGGGARPEIRLYDNGTRIAGAARGVSIPGAPTCPAKVECFALSLTPGSHVIGVTGAVDGVEGPRQFVTVTMPGVEKAGTMRILAVGIDVYKNPKYQLRFARADARAFADSMRLGSRGRRVVLDTLFDAAATRDGLEDRLIAIAEEAKPEDVFVLYYAGHGIEATIGSARSFFLVPTDVRDMSSPALLGGRGISTARLLELMRNIPARQKLLIIDACQSGAVATAWSWQQPTHEALRDVASGTGTWVMAASRPQENATEIPALAHGVFTFAVLEAIGGAPPKEVNVLDLMTDVNARVPQLSLKYGTPRQRPIILAAGEPFILLVK